MASGVSDPLDSLSHAPLQTLGFTHLLLIKELSSSSESKYVYYTPIELSWENVIGAHKPSWQERGNQSKLLVQLIPLNDIKGMNSVVVETVISHMTFRHDNRGETHVNLTAVESARHKAMMKASKRIIKRCWRE